jgi:hypothetical protein
VAGGMNMYAQYAFTGAAAPAHYEYMQSRWFGLADTAEVPGTPDVWTLEDFTDILPTAGEWQ